MHDTPAKPMSAQDVVLSRYVQDLPSVPPPPDGFQERRAAVVERVRDVTKSGSWDVERAMIETDSYYQRALAVAIVEERRINDRARFEDRLEHEREKTAAANARADKAEAQIEKDRDGWKGMWRGVAASVIAAGILAVIALLIALSKPH
jgi:hypothetical protein